MNKLKALVGKSFYLGTLFDIPFKLHWSIIPFFLIIPIIGYQIHMSITESLLLLLLVVTVIISVLLHELGHARMASTMGIKTHDILISVIGGAARLENMPEEPMKEFKIAIAGPLVNLLIFVLIATPLLILSFFGKFNLDLNSTNLMRPSVFIMLIALSNLSLFLFNLLPAFPMDGGRILRAFLASRIGRLKATKLAANIGKIFAGLMVIFGIFYMYPVMALIGIFIYMMADLEYSQEKANQVLRNTTAMSVSRRDFSTVRMVTPMNELIQDHFDTGEVNFIIVDANNKPKGIIDKYRLEDAMREKNGDMTVSYYLNSRYAIVNVQDSIFDVYKQIVGNDYPLALVMDYGELYGIIDRKTLAEVISAKK